MSVCELSKGLQDFKTPFYASVTVDGKEKREIKKGIFVCPLQENCLVTACYKNS